MGNIRTTLQIERSDYELGILMQVSFSVFKLFPDLSFQKITKLSVSSLVPYVEQAKRNSSYAA